MKLLYAHASPYARKARIVIAEKELTGIEQIAVSPFDLPPDLIAANPLGKVPVLLRDGEPALYDSPVICEYLDALGTANQLTPASGAARWTALTRHALADGVLDATFAIACELHRRPEHERSPDWIKRWVASISRSLGVLERDIADFGSAVTLAHIGVGCALSYLDLRASALVDWRMDHPELARWYAVFAARPSMQSTQPNA